RNQKTGRIQNPQASKTRPVGLDGGPKQWALSLEEKEKHFSQKRHGSLGKALIQSFAGQGTVMAERERRT
ncbi:hypothetical protein, partial [Anoxybacillus flavithermus]|uniref:hypothetical protein n=1 Tax=Anoxybacillus flavithermus TaxID=33934 RepID=UPI001867FFE0